MEEYRSKTNGVKIPNIKINLKVHESEQNANSI